MDLLELHATHPDRAAISSLLIRFDESAAASGLPEIERLATTVSTWWPEILAVITTGVTSLRSPHHSHQRTTVNPASTQDPDATVKLDDLRTRGLTVFGPVTRKASAEEEAVHDGLTR